MANVQFKIDSDLYEKYKSVAKKNGLELQYLNPKIFKEAIVNYISNNDEIDKILEHNLSHE